MRLLLFIFLLAFGTGLGQDLKHNYHPLRPEKVPKEVLKEIFTANEKIAGARVIDGSSAKKEFVKLIKNANKSFANLDTQRVLMYNDTIAQYINSIVKAVMAANPELSSRKMYVFTLRDEEVNAANHGPTLLTLNLGLLAKANTYEEFVFVICHELSHEYLDHVYASVENYCKATNDPKFKRKVRQLKRQEYNSAKSLELLAAKTISGLRRHNRQQELEADSLGLIFYNRLGLHQAQTLSLMGLLDSAEVPFSHKPLHFQEYFDRDKTFFDNEWLVIDTSRYYWAPDSSLWVLPDSMKTHPDCKVRLEKLKSMCGSVEDTKLVDQREFLHMRNLARFELLEEFLSNEDYANALYYAMQIQLEFPENIYVSNVVLNSLIEMANAIKDHRFSQVVDHPNYFYYPQFNVTLCFLHNLNSASMRKIAVTYFKNHLQKVQNDDFTGYNAILMKAWETPKEKLPGLIDVYRENYKDTFYLKKLESKYKPKKK